MSIPDAVVRQFAPIVVFHPQETFFPCSFAHLVQGASLCGGGVINGRGGIIPPVPNMTEAAFNNYMAHANPALSYFLDINPSQYGGMAPDGTSPPPLYYAVQELEDCVEITYVLLFAFQGGQTAHADRKGTSFDCIVNSYGQHQGDYEEFRVQVGQGTDGSYGVLQVAFEAHGDFTAYTPDRVQWQGSHPIVHSALNGHSLHNTLDQGNWHSEAYQSGMLDIGSTLGEGRRLDGSQSSVALVRLGLDASGNVIGNQNWSKFSGRLGRSDNHSLTGATHYDGSGLNSPDWSFVKLTEGFIRSVKPDALDDYKTGIGPVGPAARDYIHPGDGLPRMTASDQKGWNWCNKCGGLHFPAAGGVCPTGGHHETSGSGNYVLLNGAPVRYKAQTNWRWCHKCGGLHYARAQGVCPTGGQHETGGSASYGLCSGDLPSTLGTDGRLGNNQMLQSRHKHYTVVNQGDGNLVVYGQDVVWKSNTAAHPPGNCVLVNQGDGNVVVYNDSNGAVVWAAGTGGRAHGQTTLVMQDDGNLVSYGPNGPIWASGVTRPDYLGQSGWRWCRKCSGLHFGEGASACPAGGVHASDGSANYGLCHL